VLGRLPLLGVEPLQQLLEAGMRNLRRGHVPEV
jgi:hypothetical protein